MISEKDPVKPFVIGVSGEGGEATTDDPDGVPSRRNRTRGAASAIVPPLIFGAILIGIWYYISYVILTPERRFLLEPPHKVLKVGFLEWDNFSEILVGLWSSTQVAAIGLGIAIVLGFSVAILMSQAKPIERGVFPYMVMLQAIPILAIVPLIGFWFGFGFKSRVVVCVIISLFPIIVNTLFGLQSAKQGTHNLFTLHHAGRLTRLRWLTFPNALPAIFAGLRISAGLSVIGAIVGDFFFAQGEAGIGQLLKRYASFLQGEQLLAAVFMSSALGVTVFLLFGWIQQRVVGKWYASEGPGS
jgi:NitT/TauT family transport system permease protein